LHGLLRFGEEFEGEEGEHGDDGADRSLAVGRIRIAWNPSPGRSADGA
jgi:hypothetical protein